MSRRNENPAWKIGDVVYYIGHTAKCPDKACAKNLRNLPKILGIVSENITHDGYIPIRRDGDRGQIYVRSFHLQRGTPRACFGRKVDVYKVGDHIRYIGHTAQCHQDCIYRGEPWRKVGILGIVTSDIHNFVQVKFNGEDKSVRPDILHIEKLTKGQRVALALEGELPCTK